MNHPIFLDNEDSWPAEVRKILECADHYANGQNDSDLVSSVHDALEGQSIVGYHFTRLTNEEIFSIKRDGLTLLTRDFMEKKLQNAYEQNYISSNLLQKIQECQNNNVNLSPRFGFSFLYLFPPRPNDPYQFLRWWGGEAIFNCFCYNDPHRITLKSIGTPCIVRILIPRDALKYQTIAGGFVYRFYKNRGQNYPEWSNAECSRTLAVYDIIQTDTQDR